MFNNAKSITISGKEAKRIDLNGGLLWSKVPPIETGCYVEYEFADGVRQRKDFDSTGALNVWLVGPGFAATGHLKIFRSKDFDNEMTSLANSLVNQHKVLSMDLSGFNTTGAESAREMLLNCDLLQSIDVSGLDTSQMITMHSMFRGCDSLKTLDLSNFDTKNVNTFANFLYECFSLESVNLTSFSTPKLTVTSGMFRDCQKLKILDLSSFDFSLATNTGSMFLRCNSVTEAYGRTQADCDKLNASSSKPVNVVFVVKEAAAQTLSAMSIQPQATNEENISMLDSMNITTEVA